MLPRSALIQKGEIKLMPKKKTAKKEDQTKEVVKTGDSAQKKEKSLVVAVEDKSDRAISLVDTVVQCDSGESRVGKFPDLWRRTSEALDQEYSEQEKLSGQIVTLTQKTTDLMRTARDSAADQLMDIIDDMEKRGQISVPKS